MTSLQGLLPHPGSNNWRKTRSLTADGEDDLIVVRHILIREVWLEKRPWPHAVYKVDVMSQTSNWFVFKRYKEFYALHQKLVKKYGIPKELLPPRRLANNLSVENLEHRREALEHYLQRILNSSRGALNRSEELVEFLDVKSHDVPHVTKDLANFLKRNGPSILMSKEIFHLSPSQLYCITKQLQLPHPGENKNIDLGNLYDFVSQLEKLSVTDYISQSSHGVQHEHAFTFDVGLFTSLKLLQMDACNVEALRGFASLKPRLRKLTARYCLESMKELLIDAAVEKRTAPEVRLSAETWRVQAAVRLAENRVVLQPWLALTHVNFSHNQISTFDNAMTLLPALVQLDLSHNKLTHLDLQMLTAKNLEMLSLAHNQVCLISGTVMPLDNLKRLNLSNNVIQSMEGLLSAQGLEELDVSHNNIMLIAEVKKLTALSNLTALSVAGNYFTKRRRHRLMIFGYFRERQLILDKRCISPKEKAKIEAKIAALEGMQDMDDSLSSISTVSEESDFDSGIEGYHGGKRLSVLAEDNEDGFEIIPRYKWNGSVPSDRETDSPSDDADSDAELGLVQSKENLTREDWDRILHAKKDGRSLVPVSDSRSSFCSSRTLTSNVTTEAEGARRGTLVASSEERSAWMPTGAIPRRLGTSHASSESGGDDPDTLESRLVAPCSNVSPTKMVRVSSEARAVDSDCGDPVLRKSTSVSLESASWVKSLFRRVSKTPSSIDAVDASSVQSLGSPATSSAVVIIPEVAETKVEEKDISRSYDDNCDFEAAHECTEHDDADEVNADET